MANYYYSGQGSFYFAERTAGGAAKGFIPIGNVTQATIDITVDKFEHKESESGQRLLDLTIIKEKKGKLNVTFDSLSMDNLALSLYGTRSSVTGATVTGEDIVGYLGQTTMLSRPSVSSVTITNAAGSTTYVAGTDYILNATYGTITVPATGSAITEGQALRANYTYAAYNNMEAFMTGSAPERWIRFQGLNTADGSRVLLDVFRARLDPMTGLSLINDELSVPQMSMDILADATKTSGSQFFRMKYL